jgi:hypothetical protein
MDGSPASLPAALRTLRVGIDNELRIRRTVHLAAAKIEDLELRVSRLSAALADASTDADSSPETRR